jgi:hypothetical protein
VDAKRRNAEATITRRAKLLKTLVNKGADIHNSESVKETITKQQHWKNKTKELAVKTYDYFLKMHGQTWKKPVYKTVRTIPFIPTEEELNNLIAGCNRITVRNCQIITCEIVQLFNFKISRFYSFMALTTLFFHIFSQIIA